MRLRPHVGQSGSDVEPFGEWWPRVREQLPHVPEDVAEHWVHRNFNDTPYAFLPLDRLRFERQPWSTDQLNAVRFGSHWGNRPDLGKLDGAEERNDPLACMMIEAGTWPAPVLVLDNRDGQKETGGEPMSRWHLIEGHLRLTYLRGLLRRGIANPQHDVWVVTLVAGESTKKIDLHGNISAGYMRQKLADAFESLALGEGSIKERLADACRGQMLHLGEASFPADKREQWLELMDALRRKSRAVDSINAMSVREATHHARTILELWTWNCDERAGQEALRKAKR
jgi:hypothetical protein